MTDPVPPTAPTAVVRAFLTSLERLDVDAAVALLDPDVVYENVSLPTFRGRDATARVLHQLGRRASGFEATCHAVAESGTTVLTERTDAIVVGRFRMAFWVCGRFEVVDGRITHWRDYFDWAATTAATFVGLGQAVRSLVAGSARSAGPLPPTERTAPSRR